MFTICAFNLRPRGWANHPDKALWTYPFLLQLTPPRGGERNKMHFCDLLIGATTHAPRVGANR